MTDPTDLCFLPAVELVARLRSGALSAVEVLEAHLRRIERVNPAVNAIVTLVPERARAEARALDQARARGEPAGALHGLPIAVKDLQETAGIRTTFGSPLFADFVPTRDSLLVERLRQAGAVVIGKTNTPEFGAGSQTFNPVFGATKNPWDPARTCGGSSGGAAVALATGMIPLADGSDMGGSLRNPASFCNVVGLRPSPGRVPVWPSVDAWFTLSVDGPMARTVADLALLLSAIAGPDDRSPIALADPGAGFAGSLDRNLAGVRIAWADDLDLPWGAEVLEVVDRARPVFESLGAVVETAAPDFRGADQAFKAWRAWAFEAKLGDLHRRHAGRIKATVAGEIVRGRALGGPDLARAEQARSALYQRVREFFDRYDFLILPTVQVLPFPITTEYPMEIEGVAMESYIDWMKSCWFVSTVGNPALSVPAGFSSEGLPIGLQIVGRHRDDLGVLQLGHAFEAATGHGRRRPPIGGAAA
jgi:amidase